MVKCVVSGCPNRIVSYNRGVFNRPPRRFFNFPKDPDRVKVWLAALRETDRETDRDTSEQLVICEEHFLPEDISKKGLISDTIPITPPFFDRPLSPMGSWGPEQWSTGDLDVGEEDKSRAPNAPPSQKQGPGRLENPPAGQSISDPQQQNKTPSTTTGLNAPLSLLTQGFLQLLLAAPDGSVDLRQAAASLQTPTRRVRNIVNVLDDIGLIHRESERRISWIGNTSICSFLWRNPLKFLTALEKLQLVEHKLDRLITSCSQQLLDLTDNVDNAALAYVRCEDIARLATQEQTVIIIKAPPETKLHIPEPKEDRIHLHLVAEKSPITVLNFEVDSAGVPTSSPTARSSVVFTELKEGRVGARSARSDSCDLTEEDADGGSKADSEAVGKKTDQTKTVGQTFTGQARCMSGQPTEVGPPCQSPTCLRSSKHACSSLTEADREKIFKCFWEDMDWEQRKNYMCSLVEVIAVQRRRGSGCSQMESSLVFHLSVDGWRRRVCKALFLATLGLQESMVLKWIREKRETNEIGGEVQEDFPAGPSRPAVS